MSSKNSAEINVDFPIYGLRFINSKTLLAVGGGGEGNNGIPNKITAIKCHFNSPDKERRLQKFREITLPPNEDLPMCVAVARDVADDSVRYTIFVGCNQSTQLAKQMGINNNLRKYVYTDEEHLRFVDAVQYDDNVLPQSLGEYPKIVHLTPENTVGALMTSKVPSEIYIFRPDTLELLLQYRPAVSGEVKDFHLSSLDDTSLVYVTASVVEEVNVNSGKVVVSSTNASRATANKLAKYFLSKVRYIGQSKVAVTAALRSGKGAAVFHYDLAEQKITNERIISRKMKGVVAIDVSESAGVIAAAGNDFSVTLMRTSDLKIVKTFPNLHKFAITSLSFAPNGKRLATGSASNTLNVVNIPAKIGRSGSLIGSLFLYLFFIILAAGLAILVQASHNSGDLDRLMHVLAEYGGKAAVIACHYGSHYGKIALDLLQKYGDVYFHKAQHYGKIGYELLKEKSLEGYSVVKEKLNKDSPAEWVNEVVAETEVSSTTDDYVSVVTRDIDSLTSGIDKNELDTESIISEAVRTEAVSASASASTSVDVVDSASIKASSSVVDTPDVVHSIRTESVPRPQEGESTVPQPANKSEQTEKSSVRSKESSEVPKVESSDISKAHTEIPEVEASSKIETKSSASEASQVIPNVASSVADVVYAEIPDVPSPAVIQSESSAPVPEASSAIDTQEAPADSEASPQSDNAKDIAETVNAESLEVPENTHSEAGTIPGPTEEKATVLEVASAEPIQSVKEAVVENIVVDKETVAEPAAAPEPAEQIGVETSEEQVHTIEIDDTPDVPVAEHKADEAAESTSQTTSEQTSGNEQDTSREDGPIPEKGEAIENIADPAPESKSEPVIEHVSVNAEPAIEPSVESSVEHPVETAENIIKEEATQVADTNEEAVHTATAQPIVEQLELIVHAEAQHPDHAPQAVPVEQEPVEHVEHAAPAQEVESKANPSPEATIAQNEPPVQSAQPQAEEAPAQPIAEPVVEPVVEPIVEPVVEAAAEQATPVVEHIDSQTLEQSMPSGGEAAHDEL